MGVHMAFWVLFRCPRRFKMDQRVTKMTARDTKKAPKTFQRVSRRSLRVPKDISKGSMLSQWPPRLILVWFFVIFGRTWHTFWTYTARYMDGWMDRLIGRDTDGWMDGWLERWIDRWIYR